MRMQLVMCGMNEILAKVRHSEMSIVLGMNKVNLASQLLR